MNDNINLVEILKDAPDGTKLWSPIIGECTLLGVDENEHIDSQLEEYPISCEDNKGRCFSFTKEGKFFNYDNDTECVLFPSKCDRNWSTFKAPKKHKEFKPFQKVLIKQLIGENFDKVAWVATNYSHYDEDLKQHYCTMTYGVDDDQIIPYEGNEKLLGTCTTF